MLNTLYIRLLQNYADKVGMYKFFVTKYNEKNLQIRYQTLTIPIITCFILSK